MNVSDLLLIVRFLLQVSVTIRIFCDKSLEAVLAIQSSRLSTKITAISFFNTCYYVQTRIFRDVHSIGSKEFLLEIALSPSITETVMNSVAD